MADFGFRIVDCGMKEGRWAKYEGRGMILDCVGRNKKLPA